MPTQLFSRTSVARNQIGSGFQAFVIVVLILSVLSIALRFWSRLLGPSGAQHQRRFWWDDWVALASMPIILCYLSLALVMVDLGLGYHVWELPPDNITTAAKLIYVLYYLYDASLFLTKMSALFFYNRIFPKYANARWFNLALWSLYGLNVLWFIGIILGTIFMCKPVEKGWNPLLPGSCGETSSLWIGSAIPSVVIDFLILLLPLPKIWGLQISRVRKAALSIVFALGYGVIVVSLGRLITVLKSGSALNTDITYAGVPIVYWVSAEIPISLIVICLPAMLPLGRHLSQQYFSPLASKIRTVYSNNSLGSKNDERYRKYDDSAIRMPKIPHPAINDLGTRPSWSTSRGRLNLSPQEDNYSALVKVNREPHDTDGMSSQHIMVRSDVQVS